MIDKIHFSLNISICLINMILCVLFYNINSLDLSESYLSKDFISQMEENNQISLAYSSFMFIYSFLFIVIYQEIYGNDILKDFIINTFYLSFIASISFNNYNILGIIKNEEKNFPLTYLDIPNYHIDTLIYIYHYIQGLLLLLTLLTIIKGSIAFYRGIKNYIINYFQHGGSIFYFEISHLIS